MKLQKVKICMIIICMLAAGICYSCDKKSGSADGAELETLGEEISPELLDGQEPADDIIDVIEASEPESLCYVHICGEVREPGVYELPENQRIFNVVELAGGFTGEAVTEYLNLAQPVTDGMKLVVPSKEDLEKGILPSEPGGGEEPAKVNINEAAKEQLMTLKGIGESRAEDIIRFRKEQGRFETIEDIMKVPGIKDAAFAKIKDDITV